MKKFANSLANSVGFEYSGSNFCLVAPVSLETSWNSFFTVTLAIMYFLLDTHSLGIFE